MSRPYTTPRPRQHNAHVWAWVSWRRKKDNPPAPKKERPKPYTVGRFNSGGRALGRFGKW